MGTSSQYRHAPLPWWLGSTLPQLHKARPYPPLTGPPPLPAQVRVPLEDGLVGVAAEFFPLNPDVLAVAGPAAVRLIWAERVVLPGGASGTAALVRQSEVELTEAMAEGDSLTSL